MRREYDPRIQKSEDKHTHYEEELMRAKHAIDKKADKAARSRRGGVEPDDGDGDHDAQARSSSEPPPGSTVESSMKIKDHWKMSGNEIIRIHVTPRVALFTPSGTQCPVPVEQLSHTRKVNMTKVHGKVKESLTDDWTKQEDAHRKMPSSWTGETIFTRKSEEDHQVIESAAARAGDDHQDKEPDTLRKSGSAWEAHGGSPSMAQSSTSVVCNHECPSTSLEKYVLSPSVGGWHTHSTSPAGDPLGKGNRAWGEGSTSEKEIEERYLLDEVSEERALLEILISLGVEQSIASVKVSELYSPPRVTEAARTRPDLGIKGLKAFDLTTPRPNGGN